MKYAFLPFCIIGAVFIFIAGSVPAEFGVSSVPRLLAQDDKTDDLTEGTKARLGKGDINEVKYSPDGTKLGVGKCYRHLDLRRTNG